MNEELILVLRFVDYAKRKLNFKSTEINFAGDLARIDKAVEKELGKTLSYARRKVIELEKKERYAELTNKEKDELHSFRCLFSHLQTEAKKGVYTSKERRRRFLNKIGYDYTGEWQGAKYFDLFGGQNNFYGKTVSSVDGSKGFNYNELLEKFSIKKIK